MLYIHNIINDALLRFLEIIVQFLFSLYLLLFIHDFTFIHVFFDFFL